MVSPASRILSAISLGVFCRSAPSTSAIMRSRKVSPGFDVIFDLDLIGEHARAAGDGRTIAARLANDGSRFAGDRRLVDRGDAFDDLAVGRDQLAGGHEHHIARTQLRARYLLDLAVAQHAFAMVSERALRSVSACALPRPSAMASAKFANNTVNHSHKVICRLNLKRRSAAEQQHRCDHAADLDDEHDGIAHHVVADSVSRSASADARAARSSIPTQLAVTLLAIQTTSESLSGSHQQVLENRPQA